MTRAVEPRHGLLANLTLLLLVGWPAASAHAGSGAMFGEASRTAALADAVTARRAELSSIAFNPGALATLQGGQFAATAHVGWLNLGFQRHSEPEQDLDRTIAGFGFAVGSQLPGPDWLRAARLAVAVHVPAAHALRFKAPSRPDEPAFPVYGARTERTALSAALAYELFSRIGIGAGLAMVPSLSLPTTVTYEQGRGATADENVVIDIERELTFGVAPLVGVRAQLIDQLALGVAYQGEIVQQAQGPNDVRAGGLLVEDLLDFYEVLSPERFSTGLALYPLEHWSLSVDAVVVHWGRYRTIHNQPPPHAFSNVVHVRAGIEGAPVEGLVLRAGYGFEPSPIPTQDAETNLLGEDVHVAAVGAGLDLRAWWAIPLRIDLHGRTHLMLTQEADKRRESLGDADPQAPGQQIDNFGYPGFSAWGSFWQAGLTLNVFFGGNEP